MKFLEHAGAFEKLLQLAEISGIFLKCIGSLYYILESSIIFMKILECSYFKKLKNCGKFLKFFEHSKPLKYCRKILEFVRINCKILELSRSFSFWKN